MSDSASVRCVIFDCDGTLVDSEYLCNFALEIRLRDLGIDESAETLVAEFRGWKLARICEAIEQRHEVRLGEDFISQYRLTVERLFAEQLRPIAGIAEALEQISQPKCVASSGPLEKIHQSLELTALAGFFGRHVFSSYVIQSWKPEPGLFLHASERMGFAPEQCLVIEDSDVGIEAARRAGMRALWFRGDAGHPSAQGITCFDHMSQLPRLLNQKTSA